MLKLTFVKQEIPSTVNGVEDAKEILNTCSYLGSVNSMSFKYPQKTVAKAPISLTCLYQTSRKYA